MADTKLSALTAVATPAGTDQVYVNQGGTSKRETVAQIGSVFGLSLSGNNVLLTPVGAAGIFAIEQNAGTPGTTEGQLSHDGTNFNIGNNNTASNCPRLILTAANARLVVGRHSDGNVDSGQVYCGRFGATTGGVDSAYLNSSGLLLVSAGRVTWTSNSNNPAASIDTGLARVAAGVTGATLGVSGAGWFQNTAGDVRNTADVTNATASFANLSDLSVSLLAGRKYGFELSMNAVDSTAADGIKLDFNGGSATVTSFSAGIMVAGGGLTDTIGVAVTTALATAVTVTTMTGEQNVVVRGHVVCNAAGTFIPRQAQNAHSTGTLTVRLGATLRAWDCAN